MTRSSAVRSTVTSRADAVRSGPIAYRIPEVFSTLGITSLYDWRDGYAGKGKTAVDDVCEMGRSIAYRGTTAISSVFTTGEYSADLELSASDYFRENTEKAFGTSSTYSALTVFCWFKKESNGTTGELINKWRAVSPKNSWKIRTTSGNLVTLYISSNGNSTALNINSVSTITDTSWHFVCFVNDQPSSALKLYIDNIDSSYSFITGSAAVNIYNGVNSCWVGAAPNAGDTPVNFFDGKVGICGYCKGTAWTAQQVSGFYNMTKSLGGY